MMRPPFFFTVFISLTSFKQNYMSVSFLLVVEQSLTVKLMVLKQFLSVHACLNIVNVHWMSLYCMLHHMY